jgi:hypothetical protein
MASITEVNVASAEPTAAMMEGFVIRRTRGSIQSAGTGNVSSTEQMKFFTLGEQHVMKHSHMILRVHVPEQNVDISAFHGSDQLGARTVMAAEINDRLGSLFKTKIMPQMVRRSPLQGLQAVFIFMTDVTVVNREVETNANFQRAMRGLTNSGGSQRTLTEAMVLSWETCATTGDAMHPGTPHMLFTLEPKSNVNMENIAHNVDLTPQQLIRAVQELYNRAEDGSPLKTSTMQELSGRMAIFASYVPGNSGPTTTLFCLNSELLTYLILHIETLGLMHGSWTSQSVAVPIRTIGGGAMGGQPGRVLVGDQSGLPPALTDDERSYGRLGACLRYPRFERGAVCTPGYSLSFLWCGRNVTDVWATMAFMLTDYCNASAPQLPAILLTVDGWMDRIHVATNRNGDITRVVIVATPGEVTSAVFGALQGQQLACTPNGDFVMLVFPPGRCMACRPWKCYDCGSNSHMRADCPNNGRPWAQKIIPCALCGKPTGGHHSHTLDTCDAHLQVNDPGKQLGCPICTHKGHPATHCPVWRGPNGVMHVPPLLTSVLAQFPDWQIVQPNAAMGSVSGVKRAWYNTGTMSVNVHPVTPTLTYAESLRSFTPSPGTSTSDSEQGGSRLERWTAGNGNEELVQLAKSLYAKMDTMSKSVEDIKKVQELQTNGMELLHAASGAQTTAIGKLQTAAAKHKEFYEQIQRAHQAAMALNASSTTEDMDDDSGATTPPGEDPTTATGQ